MNITCVICSELFISNVDIYSTSCGHIFHYNCLLQWLANSKTCPQCRTKVTESKLIHLYITSNSENANGNSAVLQQKVDDLHYQLNLKEANVKKIQSDNEQLWIDKVELISQLEKLKRKRLKHSSLIEAQNTQIQLYKQEAANCSCLKVELAEMKANMKIFSDVQAIRDGNKQEVENIIKNENNIETLAVATIALKKSLLESNKKIRQLQHQLKSVNNELLKYRKTCRIHKYEALKLKYDELKINYELETAYLKQKFVELQEKSASDSLNISIQQILSESPVNYHRPLKHSHTVNFNTNLSTSHSLVPEIETTTELNIDSNVEKKKNGTKRKGTILEISTIEKMCETADKEKDVELPIKKRQMTMHLELSGSASNQTSNMFYNGLGYSSKIDIYPSAKTIPPRKSKSSNNMKQSKLKFKKLSAEAGVTSRTISNG